MILYGFVGRKNIGIMIKYTVSVLMRKSKLFSTVLLFGVLLCSTLNTVLSEAIEKTERALLVIMIINCFCAFSSYVVCLMKISVSHLINVNCRLASSLFLPKINVVQIILLTALFCAFVLL